MFESTISYQAPRARQAQEDAELTKYTTLGNLCSVNSVVTPALPALSMEARTW